MKTCKPYCNTWHEYKYLGGERGVHLALFWIHTENKGKICQVQVMFSGDGVGGVGWTGKRKQKDKGRKMARYEEKSTVSCQSKRTATQCLIHALSELCGRCWEPTWVKAFKDVLNLPDTPIKKVFIVLWGTHPALYTPCSYSCRRLQNTFVSISIHCPFNCQWNMGRGALTEPMVLKPGEDV